MLLIPIHSYYPGYAGRIIHLHTSTVRRMIGRRPQTKNHRRQLHLLLLQRRRAPLRQQSRLKRPRRHGEKQQAN